LDIILANGPITLTATVCLEPKPLTVRASSPRDKDSRIVHEARAEAVQALPTCQSRQPNLVAQPLLTRTASIAPSDTPLAAVTMSQTPATASSSSDFQAIFDTSMKEYKKKTKKDLLAHPLMAQLQTCNSPADILAVLHTQVEKFEQSTSSDEKLTKWLTPTVNVLFAFSGVIGAGVGLVSSIRTILLRSTL